MTFADELKKANEFIIKDVVLTENEKLKILKHGDIANEILNLLSQVNRDGLQHSNSLLIAIVTKYLSATSSNSDSFIAKTNAFCDELKRTTIQLDKALNEVQK